MSPPLGSVIVSMRALASTEQLPCTQELASEREAWNKKQDELEQQMKDIQASHRRQRAYPLPRVDAD